MRQTGTGVYKFEVNYFDQGVMEVFKKIKKGEVVYKVTLHEIIYEATSSGITYKVTSGEVISKVTSSDKGIIDSKTGKPGIIISTWTIVRPNGKKQKSKSKLRKIIITQEVRKEN